ncbi:hypothetical protein Ari01nite_40960 [Paractinoplanes rishiriensis]|uniref:Uncharacterized protein n=1 Tax=Paractinoplanes rishiriensis TaxID=1050105 RepID=A0A919JWS0_9ACTN|nr:hypothetical protein Ari01nite_40960 [Actinoplanes rishiriensis]
MLSGESWTFCTAYPSAGVAVTNSTTPSEVIRITACPPSTLKERTNVRRPSAAVVTVQPSSVVVGGVVARPGADVVAEPDVGVGAVVRGLREVGAVVGRDGASPGPVTLGNGAGKLVAFAAGNWASAVSAGSLVRSTGRIATLPSTMLVAVAAHQPATGANRKLPI